MKAETVCQKQAKTAQYADFILSYTMRNLLSKLFTSDAYNEIIER